MAATMLAPSLPSPTIETRGIIVRRVYVLAVARESATQKRDAVKRLTFGASSAKMVRSVRADCLNLPEPFDR
jgi:hypothetical protein